MAMPYEQWQTALQQHHTDLARRQQQGHPAASTLTPGMSPALQQRLLPIAQPTRPAAATSIGGHLESSSQTRPMPHSSSRTSSSSRTESPTLRRVRTWNRQSFDTWKEILPEWAYDKGVADLATEFLNLQQGDFVNEPLQLQCVAGPAIAEALTNLKRTWFVALVTPWLTICFANFDNYIPQKPTSYAVYSFWTWIFLAPILLLCLRSELRCLKRTMIPVLQVTQTIELCGKTLDANSYWIWCSLALLMSFVSHLDLINSGLFLGVTIKTMWSSHGVYWQDAWEKTVKQSYLPDLFSKFDRAVFITWLLMYMQFFGALLSFLPVYSLREFARNTPWEGVYTLAQQCRGWEEKPHEVDYKQSTAQDAKKLKQWSLPIRTRYQVAADRGDHYTDHGLVLLSLAEAGRMASLGFLRFEYVRVKSAYYLQSKEKVPAAYTLIYRFTTNAISRVFLSHILGHGLSTNLQSSLNSLTAYIDGENLHYELIFFLGVSVVVAVRNLFRESQRFFFLHKLLYTRNKFDDEESREENFAWRLKGLLFLYICACYLYFLLILYAFFKFIATAYCTDKMWNLMGCVQIEPMTEPEREYGTSLLAIFILTSLTPPLCIWLYKNAPDLCKEMLTYLSPGTQTHG